MILTEKFLTPRSTSVLRKVVDWMHAGYPLNRSINVMEAETGESLIDCRDTILDLYTREKKVRDEAQAIALKTVLEMVVKKELTAADGVELLEAEGVKMTEADLQAKADALAPAPVDPVKPEEEGAEKV